MPATTYLFFNGNCSDAMRFYERTLGGKLDLMTYAESPEPTPCPESLRSQIMHARLVLPDGATIMASDDTTTGNDGRMSGFAIALTFPTAAETTRVFHVFEEGGRVQMPLTKTFWSEAFGGVTDRFGTPWMVMVQGDTQ